MAGDAQGSLAYLRRAASLNPNDDLIWRSLAVAFGELGENQAAVQAAERALSVQRSDSANLLTVAQARLRIGDEFGADAALDELVQAWPEIVAAPGWAPVVEASGSSTEVVLKAAATRWANGVPSPEPLDVQPLLIHALATASADVSALKAAIPGTLAAEYAVVMSCDSRAARLLTHAGDADRRQATYWAISFRHGRLNGNGTEPAATLFTIMTSDDLLTGGGTGTLNPLNENGTRGASADRWGYRRQPIEWPPGRWQLPSQRSGLARLLRDPAGTATVAMPERLPNPCVS
jgi:hypothetical protein